MSNLKPLLKWAGGKRKLAPLITEIVSKEIPTTQNYVEPFFGGGAVYFELYKKNLFTTAEVNDVVPQLVNFYKTLSNAQSVDEIYKSISEKFEEFNALEETEERKDYFTKMRGEFNHLWLEEQRKTVKHKEFPDYLTEENSIKSTILLYVINKTCFNGLFRVNKSGMFNVPLGSYKKIVMPSLSEFKETTGALKKTEVHFGDYEVLIQKYLESKNTFIYLDPPYVANSKTSDFTSYSKEGFKGDDNPDAEHLRLSENFELITESGTKAILSNHNNPKALSIFVENKEDLFVYEINLTKTIGRVKDSTNTSSELLISTFEIKTLQESRIN